LPETSNIFILDIHLASILVTNGNRYLPVVYLTSVVKYNLHIKVVKPVYCTLHTPVQQTCSHFIHYSVMIDWLMFNTNFSSISAILWLHYSVMSITLLPYTRHCPILYNISFRSSISIYATTVPLYTIICHLQLPVQTVPITTKVVSSNPVHGKVYSQGLKNLGPPH
jgi:hypothetical protein